MCLDAWTDLDAWVFCHATPKKRLQKAVFFWLDALDARMRVSGHIQAPQLNCGGVVF